MYWKEHFGINDLREGDPVNLCGNEYRIINGILRQRGLYSDSQSQTKDCFAFKWGLRDTYESESVQEDSRRWLIERYLNNDPARLSEWLSPGFRVLDAGCGAGHSAILFFGELLNDVNYLGVDISSAVDVAAQRFKEKNLNGEFLQANILDLPFNEPAFDLIFSEGVLHHTDSTEQAVKYISSLLVPGGRFLFYVYRQKGPIREFVDDYIREHMRNLSDQQVWDALMPLTELGRALGLAGVTIDVPSDIPFLDIPAGKHDLQRLFYWHIFKAYYKPDWNLDELNHVNFDWYRPMNCQRQTPEEVKSWCEQAGLSIESLNVQEAGITAVCIKD